jgi:hypothetical protein
MTGPTAFRCFAWILPLFLLGGCDRFFAPSQPPGPVKHVLFIGNSYTFENDLPSLFANLARAGKHAVVADMAAVGGATLQQHLGMAATRDKLAAKRWDFVVLQEQSVVPAVSAMRAGQMYPAVRQYVQNIRAIGAKPMLLLTWGRRDGLREAGFHNFQTMQAELTDAYMTIADELNVSVAPAGVAWQIAVEHGNGKELWATDGSHPSERGSYLTACVLYAAIFRESPVGLPTSGGLSSKTAQALQNLAKDTVLQSQASWHLRP